MAKVRLLDPNDAKRRLDRYELIGELASGGMATVFLGRLGGVGGFQRFVAIKRLHPHLANEQEFIEMFLDEARLAAGIHHPHVVPILEVGESDSGYYLVMEYVEGDTLARLMARALARAQPIPRPVLIRILLDALAGLHAAHELVDAQGVPVKLVHRDVSPQNVLVGVDGCSRITDFGVAHAASRLQSSRADRLKGKLAYMAPEQARSGQLDQRADIFAMGVILWEVLAGKRLFKAETEALTLQKVTLEPIPRLGSVVPELHPAIEAVADKALERDPGRRYTTAADMAEALERAARAAASASATDLGVASPREVAAYVQGALGEDIAAQRESVRAWLAHSEPSLPHPSMRTGDAGKLGPPPGHDVTMTMPLDRSVPQSRYGEARGPATGAPPPSPRAQAVASPPTTPVPPYPAGEIVAPAASQRKPTLADAPFALVSPRPQAPSPASHSVPMGGAPPYSPPRQAPLPQFPGVRSRALPLNLDGAAPGETPVEPVDDDDEDHETLLMDREAAAAQAKALAGRHAATTTQPSAALAYPDEGTPSTSIESLMRPLSSAPNRIPQLVALGVALLFAVGGFVMWLQLRGEPALPTVATPGSAVHEEAPHPPPAPAPPPVVTVTATPVSVVPASPTAAAVDVRPRLKGKLPHAKAASGASPPALGPAAPAPEPAKLPEDMANPYR